MNDYMKCRYGESEEIKKPTYIGKIDHIDKKRHHEVYDSMISTLSRGAFFGAHPKLEKRTPTLEKKNSNCPKPFPQ